MLENTQQQVILTLAPLTRRAKNALFQAATEEASKAETRLYCFYKLNKKLEVEHPITWAQLQAPLVQAKLDAYENIDIIMHQPTID